MNEKEKKFLKDNPLLAEMMAVLTRSQGEDVAQRMLMDTSKISGYLAKNEMYSMSVFLMIARLADRVIGHRQPPGREAETIMLYELCRAIAEDERYKKIVDGLIKIK